MSNVYYLFFVGVCVYVWPVCDHHMYNTYSQTRVWVCISITYKYQSLPAYKIEIMYQMYVMDKIPINSSGVFFLYHVHVSLASIFVARKWN